MPANTATRADDREPAEERGGDARIVRRLAVWALVGAAIAGSAIIQRRRVRDRIRRELLDEDEGRDG